MIRRPTRSTRTDTLFPYTTLFRSGNDWFGVTHDGAAAEIFTVPAALCFQVPQNASLLSAAVIEPFACVLQALTEAGGVNAADTVHIHGLGARSEEHTSELQSLMRISYAVFCLKKKKETITLT